MKPTIGKARRGGREIAIDVDRLLASAHAPPARPAALRRPAPSAEPDPGQFPRLLAPRNLAPPPGLIFVDLRSIRRVTSTH